MSHNYLRSVGQITAIFAVATALAACTTSNEASDAARDSIAVVTPMDSSAPMSKSGTLTDAQIANIVLTANSADSAAGAVAMPKAKRADIRDFARQMTLDHGMLNDSVRALATRMNMAPAASEMSEQMLRDASASSSALSSASDFDRAYIDGEVAMHRNVLRMIVESLIPQARNSELKTLLQTARLSVIAHLERAEQIASTAAPK